ncbi:MAG: hypothetical protein F6K31_28245 [Symploca sp. SIO2G7]|nr:hypothetical protein [Symploca sp. SIO2G7]
MSFVICHLSFVICHLSFVICHWLLVIGYWSLVICHWSLVTSSGGDKQAKGLINEAFHPIDLHKDGLLLYRLIENKIDVKCSMIMIIIWGGSS